MHALATGLAGWRLRRYAGDAAVGLAAWFGAVWLRVHLPIPFTDALLPPAKVGPAEAISVGIVALQLLLLYFFGLYASAEPRPRLELAGRLATVVALLGLLLAGAIFLAGREFPRSVLVLFLVLDAPGLFLWRSLAQRLWRPAIRRVALVGCGATAAELAAAIAEHHWHGLTVVGHVEAPDEAPEPVPSPALGPRLGTIGDLRRLLAEDLFDDLILATSPYGWQTTLVDELALGRPDRLSLLLVPGPFESLIGRMRYRWVSDIPLVEVVRASEWRVHVPIKRVIDLIGGAFLLLAASPVLLIAAAAVRLTSPGPVLYRQVRVGRGRRPFTLFKLRTMKVDAEEPAQEVLATRGDPRLTPVGGLLRAARIDELPQLFNVLRGEMSLVGPRPERPGFVERFLREVPGYAERFSLAPGLTGLAQVNGEYHSTAANKLRYDLAYMANWSPWLDLSILIRTVRIALSTRGV